MQKLTGQYYVKVVLAEYDIAVNKNGVDKVVDVLEPVIKYLMGDAGLDLRIVPL